MRSQVHRALLKDGRDVAIRVQDPGIARSIDSDVANVGARLRMPGLLPHDSGSATGMYPDCTEEVICGVLRLG